MRPYPIILSLTALALIGYLLLPQLTIRWQPGSGEANLRVSYAWPGAGPQALEQQVTAPLEGAFALVRDIDKITSISRAGRGSISLKLRRGADGDFVRFNVASQIRRLYPELPPEVRYPTLDYAAADSDDLTDLPVLTYTLSGPDPPTELYRYATEQLVPRLSLLRDLNRLEVTGGNKPHWRLRLRPEAVAAAGLSLAAIENHLSAYFQRRGLGYLFSEDERLYAFVDAPTETAELTPEVWANIPIPSNGPRQLKLGDLATAERVPLPPRAHYRINGENSIRLLAYATENANRLALASEFRSRVRALTFGIKRDERRKKSQETRDKKEETRDKKEETRDKKEETRDKKEETREKKEESREKKEESRDKKEESREKKEESRDKKEESRDKKEESRDKKEESREKKEESREKSQELREKKEEIRGERQEVREERQEVSASNLPAGYALHLEDDATRYLREELAKTRQRTALSMVILLLFVLIAYRNLRSLGIVFISLVVNLGLAFLCYWLLGVELNLYAFAGIAVSFGIMIDNVIIILDGLRRKGGSLGPAVIGATLTTLAGLSVIWFLSDELRTQLFELARVMAINLSTSVLVALAFVPALDRLFRARPQVQKKDQRSKDSPLTAAGGVSPIANRDSPIENRKFLPLIYTFLLRFRKTTLLLVILAFGLPIWWLPNQVENFPAYNKTIGSDFYRDQLRPHLNKYLGGSFRLFSYYVYEGSGYRPAEETRLYVGCALPDGATLAQLNDVVSQVEAYLGQFSAKIDRFTSQVYSGQNARLEITFPNGGRGGFPFTLKNRLTAYATNFGGVKWNIYGVGQGFSNDTGGRPVSFRVTLKGYNQAGLDQHSQRLANLLLKHPRVQEVNTDANISWWEKDRYEYLLQARPPDLARRGLSANDLRASLDWFDQNNQPDFYLNDGEPVALAAANPSRYDRWRLENWSIPRDSGQLNFQEVASLEKRLAPQALHKEDQQYLRLVAFEYLGSPRFGNKHLTACLDTLTAEMPLGFTAERRSYSRNEQAKEVTALMGLAVLLIFFICAVLFESLRQAFNIVLLIPITCIGIFLTFYWFNVRLDQGGYVSFLLVTGLAVNGLILVINEFNYLRKQHLDWPEAELYATALRHKITPILLTVISTAAGLIPFLLGGRNEVFWYALAAGTIGGLLFSMVVIAFISPVFFLRKEKARR
jgi:multidrug efflux pump subunit AcrB